MLRKAFALFAVLLLYAAGSTGAAPLGAPSNLPESPELSVIALKTLLTDLDAQREEVINIQRELVRRPALGPAFDGQGEEAKALWIESWLKSKGLPPAERLDSPDKRVPSSIRPNLIIFYPGTGSKTLWLIGHLDVAPAGPEELWIGSPWALRQDGDRLYGRGVEDNHQCLVAGLLLLESLDRLKIRPPISLGLIFTADAKTADQTHGLDLLLKARPELFLLRDSLIIVNDYGDSQGSIVDVAEKGLFSAKVSVWGQQSHAALPQNGVNAVTAGAKFIVELESLSRKFPAVNNLFDPPGTTFFATRVEAGEAASNQIPGKFEFHIESRFLSDYEVADIEAAIAELAQKVADDNRVRIEISPLTRLSAAKPTNVEAPVVRSLQRAVKAQLGRTPDLIGNGAVTMARALRVEPYNLPVAVWAKSDSQGAAANESVSITAILESARIFARMLFDVENLDGQ